MENIFALHPMGLGLLQVKQHTYQLIVSAWSMTLLEML